MYFKTTKDSETGKKLGEVYEKGKDAWNKRSELIGELMRDYPGMTGQFKDIGDLIVWGGISAILFSEEPDQNVWLKLGEGEYTPLETSEEGAALIERINSLPVVRYSDIGACLNHDDPRHVMGFLVGTDHFGLEMDPKWGVVIPDDCEEVTYSEFASL